MAQIPLQIEDLSISFLSRKGWIPAVRHLEFDVHSGESYALIGESGSGKSTVAFAVLNYLAANGSVTSGQILYHGENLLTKSHEELQNIRGKQISMVFQDPHTSLNPAYTIGEQLIETIRRHEKLDRRQAESTAARLLEAVQLPDPKRLIALYPHQLSGGQKQRVVIAQALSCRPEILILDEPTTALDVTTEIRFLDQLAVLRRQFQTAFLYITHDLGIVARIADRIGVIYAGQLVEEGSREDIYRHPAHPYTMALMQSIPNIRIKSQKMDAIPGRMPSLLDLPQGCIFHPRCRHAADNCINARLTMFEVSPGHRTACPRWRDLPDVVRLQPASGGQLATAKAKSDRVQLQADHVRSYYINRPALAARFLGRHPQKIRAVEDVTFDLRPGETFGLVGESGCGKSTLGRVVVRLQHLTAGKITFQSRDLMDYHTRDKSFRQKLQIIFQNPDSSLNPRHKVKTILGRPLRLFGLTSNEAELKQKCEELLNMVRLGPAFLHRFPHEMSGGEKQRVAIARAFASEPDFIVCDEVTSALDVSVQASVANLLIELQEKFHTSYLFISHDLNIVRQLSDRIAVMYLGRFVEVGNTEQIFQPPYHPYTQALLSAVSLPELGQTYQKVMLEGVVPSAANPPSGCVFHTRCPQKLGNVCQQQPPTLREIAPGHFLACHIPIDQLEQQEAVF